MACAHAGISKAELSRRLGYKKPQSFQTRYDTGKFTQEELQDIAQATGENTFQYFSISVSRRYRDLKHLLLNLRVKSLYH